ncbi:PilN domain-containing protein [bacterium]|nr:MAG: PilN domain-containing protein [bacterium]
MINLLPPEIKAQRHYSQYNRLLIHILIGVLVLAILTTGAFYVTGLMLNQEQTRLAKDIAREGDKSKNYGQIESQAKALADRLTTIEKIQSGRTNYPALLRALAEATPSDVYVASFAVEPAGKTMSLTSYAASDQAAANFKNALEASPRFNSAAIQVIEPTSDPYSAQPTSRVTFVVGLEPGALQ